MFNIQVRSNSGIMLNLTVEDRLLQMELDTGASVSIILEKVWKEIFHTPELRTSEIKLKTYTGQGLKVLGEWRVQVKYGAQEQQLPLIVVVGEGPILFGHNWLAKIQLNWLSIHKIKSPLKQILDKYSEVFHPGLGTLRGVQAKLEVKPDACP